MQCEDQKTGVKKVAAIMKAKADSSMTFFRLEQKDKEPPKYITSPGQMDEELRKRWGAIYDGNQVDNEALVTAFMSAYAQHIFKHEEVQVPPITAQDVWEAFTSTKKSAAGLDSWEPAEVKLFSWQACEWVAKLYNAIEKNGEWPPTLGVC